MTTVYKYKVWCITDGKWVEGYSDKDISTITPVCFENNTHTISPSIQLVEQISENAVTVIEEDGVTGGRFQCSHIAVTASANSREYNDISFPHPISLLSTGFQVKNENVGDIIEGKIYAHSCLGKLTATAASAATTLTVNDTFIGIYSLGQIVVGMGFYLYYHDEDVGQASLKEHLLGPLTAVDVGAKTATFTFPLTQEFPIDSLLFAVPTITSNITATDRSFTVDAVGLASMKEGYRVNFMDSGKVVECTRIVSISPSTSTITLEKTIGDTFTAGSSWVQVVVDMMRKVELGGQGFYSFGQSKIGGSYIPTNTIGRLRYTNKSLVDTRSFVLYFEYLY